MGRAHCSLYFHTLSWLCNLTAIIIQIFGIWMHNKNPNITENYNLMEFPFMACEGKGNRKEGNGGRLAKNRKNFQYEIVPLFPIPIIASGVELRKLYI